MKEIVFLLIVGTTYVALENTESTIKKLQVIFRHGYRYPTSLAWTENDTCAQSYKNEPWKLGNLTDLGKSQMSLLGYFLRIRYNSLIGVDPTEIQVNYSDSNRDKESAQLVYEALFKDFGNETDLKVYLLNKTIEGEMATNDTYFNSWLESIPWSKYLQDQCKNLNDTPSLKCENRKQFHKFSSQMVCEIAEKCTLPPWLDSHVQENLLADFNEIYRSFQLCSSKSLIQDNSDNMLQWIIDVFNHENEGPYKDVHLYASHDTNIGILLTRMGVFNLLKVPFGAAVAFEKHIIEGKPIIRLFYDNSTDYSNFQKLKLPGCDWDCPYDKFVEIVTGPYPCSSAIRICSETLGFAIITVCFYVFTRLLY